MMDDARWSEKLSSQRESGAVPGGPSRQSRADRPRAARANPAPIAVQGVKIARCPLPKGDAHSQWPTSRAVQGTAKYSYSTAEHATHAGDGQHGGVHGRARLSATTASSEATVPRTTSPSVMLTVKP